MYASADFVRLRYMAPRNIEFCLFLANFFAHFMPGKFVISPYSNMVFIGPAVYEEIDSDIDSPQATIKESTLGENIS